MNLKLINFTLLLFTAIALFFILTSGIPLIEWGIVESWGQSKKRYVRATRYAFIGLAAMWVRSQSDCIKIKPFHNFLTYTFTLGSGFH